jgi:hypothetical protein
MTMSGMKWAASEVLAHLPSECDCCGEHVPDGGLIYRACSWDRRLKRVPRLFAEHFGPRHGLPYSVCDACRTQYGQDAAEYPEHWLAAYQAEEFFLMSREACIARLDASARDAEPVRAVMSRTLPDGRSVVAVAVMRAPAVTGVHT